MTPVGFKTAYLFFALVALPQVLAGPGCARRHYGKPDCVEKCRKGWGVSGHYMGRNKWGSVVNSSNDTNLDDIVAVACGLNQTATPDPESTSTDPPCSSSSSPPPANGYVSTPSASNPGEPSNPTSPPPESTPTSPSPEPTSTSTTPSEPSPSPPPPPASPLPSTSSSSSSSTPPPPSPTSTPDNAPSPVSSPTPSPSPTPSSPNPQVASDSTGSDSFKNDALNGHNSFRALHGASALTWSDDLANAAKSWVSGCVFEHSGGKVGPYGENLAAGTGDYTITDGINAWTSESKDYDPKNPVYSHFTQVVWKGTTQLGCAVVTCPAGSIFPASYGGAQFIACEYNPPGNVIGEFDQNVQA